MQPNFNYDQVVKILPLYMQSNFNCDQGTQFPPPAPGLFGYGENHLTPGEIFTYAGSSALNLSESLTTGTAEFLLA